MRTTYHLLEPKNEALIHHINGRLRDLEKQAGIKPFGIRTKPNRNEVVIVCQTVEQRNEAKRLLDNLIHTFENSTACAIIKLPSDEEINKKIRCLITGKQGKMVKSIEEKTKTDIQIRTKEIEIKSNEPDHRRQAEHEIRNLIEQMKLMRKISIPSEVLGAVIGAQHSNLKQIERDTGVIIDIKMDKEIYVCGEEKNCKKAILQLKRVAAEKVYYNCRKQLSCHFLDYVSAAANATDLKFCESDCPNENWNQGKEYFKITVDEEDENVEPHGEINAEQLKDIIYKVLQNIQTEKCEGKVPKADLWCHFGHIYVRNVDEDDQDKSFNFEEFRTLFNCQNDGCKMLFDPAIKDMEISSLLGVLSDWPYSVEPHTRYDFQFITPSCSKIRVKIFLDGNGEPNNESSKADIDICESMSASSSPLYCLCDNFDHRAKISIAMPLCGMDVRMTLRTVSHIKSDDKTEKDFQEALRQYLDKIEIKEGEIVWPDDKELPDNFCLSYLRRCKRMSYRYSYDEQDYSVTVSEEEVLDVLDKDRKIAKENGIKTDIHIHSDKWDQLLLKGGWEPQHIVNDVPQFLSFLQAIQPNVSAPQEEEDDDDQ